MATHEYEVVVCDMWGIAYGEILTAVPTQVDWELNGIGSANIDFWILDPEASALLPPSCLPGGREIQIWRDQVLIWWGWPISASFDKAQVHLQCSGLLWPFSKRFFGPVIGNGVLNGSFEQGVDSANHWDVSNPSTDVFLNDAFLGDPVYDGRYAVRLVGAADNDGLVQLLTVTLLSGQEVDIAAWCYIDPGGGPFTPSPDNKGLRLDYVSDGGGSITTVFDPVQQSEPIGQWTLHQLSINPGPGTWDLYVILSALPQGWIVWDKVTVVTKQSVGSQPGFIVGNGLDGLMNLIVNYAQDPGAGKSDLAIPYRSGTGPIPEVQRNYLFQDNTAILDALNEYPTAGYCDFEIIYGGATNNSTETDEQGHMRMFKPFFPAKGSIKWNYPVEIDGGQITDLSGSIDGSQVATAQRVLSQGSSAGAATDLGYAAFAASLGPGRAPGGSGYAPNRVSAADASYGAYTNLVTSPSINFQPADVGKPIWSLQGHIPTGAVIDAVLNASQATWALRNDPFGNSGALLDTTGDVIGVGGVVLENSQSQVVNVAGTSQAGTSLTSLAMFTLARQRSAQIIPTPKMAADGPRGLLGNVFVGDVVPVNLQYGWLAGATALMRVAHLTLYPPTEELSVGLNVLNVAP